MIAISARLKSWVPLFQAAQMYALDLEG